MGVLAGLLWTAVAFSPNGRWIVGGGDGELRIWDAATNKLERRIEGIGGRARSIAFRPDGQTLAVATGVAGRSGAILLVDFTTGAATPIAAGKDEMLAVAFNPDGVWLAYGGTDGKVVVWSMDERKVVATIEEHTGWLHGLAFSPDGKLLASAGADQTVGIWETTNWRSLFRLPIAANAVAFSVEGDWLAIASEEHAVRMWRTQNPIVQTRAIDTGACVPLALVWAKAPQHSRIAAACSDQTVRVLAPAGNQFFNLAGHTDWAYAVAASPDGSKLASGSGDGTVRLWSAAGKALATLP
jgi:WD40 repeat protein